MRLKGWMRAALVIVLSLFIIGTLLLRPRENSNAPLGDLQQEAARALGNAPIQASMDSSTLRSAFATIPITPATQMAMAGYAPRDSYDSIHDDLNVRIALLSKSGLRIYVISADLLIFPPQLRDRLIASKHATDAYYFTASHSHSSIGGWDPSIAGKVAMGKYQEQYWDSVLLKIRRTMEQMDSQLLPTSVAYFESSVPIVKNRLSDGSPVDDKVRGIKLVREKTDSALLFSYSGHPTLLSRDLRILSGDYPSRAIELLNHSGYQYAMFLAGMMGSHRITNVDGTDFDKIDNTAARLHDTILNARYFPTTDEIKYLSYEMPLPEAQMRLTKNLVIREWLFTNLFDSFKAHITAFQLGNIILVSTPCDFSGELWMNGHIKVPENHAVMITSFNGDYIGYITEDAHYENCNHAEVRAMNWVGPHFGGFMSELISATLARISDY